MARPPARSIAPVLAATLLLAACGDDDATTAADGTFVEETTSTTAATSTEEPSPTPAAPTPTTTTLPAGADQLIEVTVVGDTVENGGRHEVAVGDTVAIVVTSDIVDEVHVHGYDVYADIGPDAATPVLVEATIPGVWEAELHDSGLVLVELAVS